MSEVDELKDRCLSLNSPPHEHPYWREWADSNGYLKKHINEACKEIARLALEKKQLEVENKKLQDKLDGLLPIGNRNTIRDFNVSRDLHNRMHASDSARKVPK